MGLKTKALRLASAIGLVGGFLMGLTAAQTAMAQQGCVPNYTVAPGDYLSGIASRFSTPGNRISYQAIVDANPGRITDPNVITVGLRLRIPCPGARSQPVTGNQTADIYVPSGDRVLIVTGSDYAPYTDKTLPNGGVTMHLVHKALQIGTDRRDYSIDWVDDWGAHFNPLLERGFYVASFPWFKPKCDQYDRLGQGGRWRCDHLRFSSPLHSVVVTYYMRADEHQTANGYSDLRNRRICRPKGYFTHDLELQGLGVTVLGDTPKDCFQRLVDGKADVVTLNADTSERVIRDLGVGAQVAELERLSTIETLHMVGLKSDPQARTLLVQLNQGLGQIHDQGLYRRILARHN